MKEDLFIAQLYTIKTFQPSLEYRDHLKLIRHEKTRRQLGEDRTNDLNKNDGWKKLFDLLNGEEECVKQGVSFKLSAPEERCNLETSEALEKLPDEVEFPGDLRNRICYDASQQRLIFMGDMSKEEKGKSLNLSQDVPYKEAIEAIFKRAQPIRYNSDKHFIAFPKLKYNFYEHDATLSIIIHPCVDESVRTKLIMRPTFSCQPEKFVAMAGVEKFFDDSLKLTDALFKEISDFYINRIQIPGVKTKFLEPCYCNAEIFVMGTPEFSDWVGFSMNNEIQQMVGYADRNNVAGYGRSILQHLMKPNEEYNWFSRDRRDADTHVRGVYGIYGTNDYCKILGITDNDPGLITRDLTWELLSIIDGDNGQQNV